MGVIGVVQLISGTSEHANDDPSGTDYVDVHGVRFEPFAISYRLDTAT